tara:strand:+ start:456 stop:944 length:489 start_codon:yes stop_codon:yes gene_type:complete
MKKFIPLLFLALPLPAFCDITHSISSSVKLESLSAATSADKIGSSYSISGNNVTTVDSNSAATIGGFGTTSNGVPSISFPSASQATSGEAFSYSTSYLEGDQTSGSAITVGTVGNFSDLTSTSAGSVGTAAVSLDNHTMTLTGGTGTGVVLTGQFVTDLTVD